MRRNWDIAAHIILVFFSITILFPILWTLRTSFATEVVAYQPKIIFKPTVSNYTRLFLEKDFARYFLNSLVVSLSVTLISVALSAPGAYAIARYKPGGSITRFLILSTDLLPPVILIVPLFIIFKNFGLVNSLPGLSLSYLAFNIPFVLWMLISFFEGVPKSLEEAALIDGASRFQAFVRIVFPLAAPGILAAAIFSFIVSWNEFLFALVLNSGKTSTFPVALAALQTSGGVRMGEVAAGVIVAILPIFVVFPFVQRYLVEGLTLGAVKS